MKAGYFLYPALLLMVGCGADEPSQAQQAASSEKRAQGSGGVIPEYQQKALEKAKKVEQQLQDAVKKRVEP